MREAKNWARSTRRFQSIPNWVKKIGIAIAARKPPSAPDIGCPAPPR
jgi:hypothetical protein